MSKKATEFQRKAMSRMYRGKEIFKPLNTGWIDENVACVREWVANIFFYRKGDATIMIPDLILVDVFTAIYFVLVTIANSAWLLRDRMIVYTYFNFGCEEYRTETERKFLLPWRVPAFCDFPYLAVTVLLPVQHYL